jgi:hypothetical protein
MVGRKMAFKDTQFVIPTTYEYVTFHGKRNFTDVIKVRVLELERLFGLYTYIRYNPMSF